MGSGGGGGGGLLHGASFSLVKYSLLHYSKGYFWFMHKNVGHNYINLGRHQLI